MLHNKTLALAAAEEWGTIITGFILMIFLFQSDPIGTFIKCTAGNTVKNQH